MPILPKAARLAPYVAPYAALPLAVPLEQPLAVPLEQPLAQPLEQPLAEPHQLPLAGLNDAARPEAAGRLKVISIDRAPRAMAIGLPLPDFEE